MPLFTFYTDRLRVLLTIWLVWIEDRLLPILFGQYLSPNMGINLLYRSVDLVISLPSTAPGSPGSENQPTNANQSRIRYGKYLCRKLINYL